jgi:hypothetical protein
MKCERYNELAGKVEAFLQRLVDTIEAGARHLTRRANSEFSKRDKDLEQTVGEKERAIGAFRETPCHQAASK